MVAQLKDNLPELCQAVEQRFGSRLPDLVFRDGVDRVEIWDAEDFDPWQGLQWNTVRVIRYRQHHENGDMVEAQWLTNLPSRQISRRCLYAMAKTRWRVENQGFNDAKNRYGHEAELARSALEANGIFAIVFADDGGRQEINLQFAQGTKLMVKPEDEERAREVLQLN